MQGTVIAFLNKGFGFVRSHETHEELFFMSQMSVTQEREK